TVEVEDGLGRRDTSYTGQISIDLLSGGGLSGNTPSPSAVDGKASFTLRIANAGYFQLVATVQETGIASVTSSTFRIQRSVCTTGNPCTDFFENDGVRLMDASLTNGGTGTIGLSVGIDNPSDCSTISNLFFYAPAEWTVDEVRATSPTTKLLVVRIAKAWRQIVPDNGVSSYRPCITASTQPPATWNNTPTIPNSGEYTFLAPDCSKTITYFCRAYVKSNK